MGVMALLDGGGPWRAFGVGVALALTLAQACLLLGLAGSRDDLRWLLWPTLAMAAIVALITSGMILEESGGDSVWRLLGIVAILDVLGTVVTVARAKIESRPTGELLVEAVERYLRAG